MSFSSEESAAPQHPLPGFLASRPSPFHVYNEKAALEDAMALEKGLKQGLPRCDFFYSVKTNPLLPLLRALNSRGWGMEVVGTENLAAALKAGCAPERLLMNGAAWTKTLLEEAVYKIGITRFTADSPDQAALLAAVVRGSEKKIHLALRLHCGESHFGFHAPQLEAAFSGFAQKNISALGLQIHSNPHGSVKGPSEISADFSDRAAKVKAALGAIQAKVSFLDFGGGIDSPHVYRPHPRELGAFHNPNEVQAFREANSQQRFTLEAAGHAISQAIAQILPEWKDEAVLFEPGRSVCTRALSTVIEVKAVKENFYPGKQVLITDGATSFLGPLHRGVHSVSPMGNEHTFVYGCLPHSGDWLFQNVKLPKMQVGDRVHIQHTGAYFLPLESSFGHGKPAIYSIDNGNIVRESLSTNPCA